MKKILLIGDSIRMGYDKNVKKAFEGVAEVYYPSDNCRFSAYVLRRLIDWKSNLECGVTLMLYIGTPDFGIVLDYVTEMFSLL